MLCLVVETPPLFLLEKKGGEGKIDHSEKNIPHLEGLLLFFLLPEHFPFTTKNLSKPCQNLKISTPIFVEKLSFNIRCEMVTLGASEESGI